MSARLLLVAALYEACVISPLVDVQLRGAVFSATTAIDDSNRGKAKAGNKVFIFYG